jgi:hypothetical protein
MAMGETTIRFASGISRNLYGANIGGTGCALLPPGDCAWNQLSTPSSQFRSRRRRFSWLTRCDRRKGQIAVERLEPLRRVARAVLQLEYLDIAFGLIFRQRLDAAEPGAVEHLGQLDRVLQRQLGARPDREMRSVRRVAEQDELVVRPAAGDDPAEVQPGLGAGQVGGVGHQAMAAQLLREDPLAQRYRFGLVHRVEAQLVPGPRIHLDDEGR